MKQETVRDGRISILKLFTELNNYWCWENRKIKLDSSKDLGLRLPKQFRREYN